MTYKEFIKKHEKDYEVLKLKEQKGMPYKEIASLYQVSSVQIRTRYQKVKLKQFLLYSDYLTQITQSDWAKKKQDICDFYLDHTQIVAYLEYGEYADILTAFRGGEPPTKVDCVIPYRYLDDTLKSQLQTKIVKARDIDKKTFKVIAKELQLTATKTSHLYQSYYNIKVLTAIDRIQPTVGFNFVDYLDKTARYPNKRWKIIKRDYNNLIQDLL